MRLRTTAGRYAGEIRDYSPGAAAAALRTGMAVRLEEPLHATPVLGRQTVTAPAPMAAGRHGIGIRPRQGRRR